MLVRQCVDYRKFFATKTNFTPDQALNFLITPLKESSINLLSEFEEQFSAGRAIDLPAGGTEQEGIALQALIERLGQLNLEDHVEVQKIACMWVQKACVLAGKPYADNWVKGCLGDILNKLTHDGICMRAYNFANELQLFKGLHRLVD